MNMDKTNQFLLNSDIMHPIQCLMREFPRRSPEVFPGLGSQKLGKLSHVQLPLQRVVEP